MLRTFNNPLRTVVLQYHDKRKESRYEKSLVGRYLNFINQLQIRREQIKEVSNRCFMERLMVEEINEMLPVFEESFKPIYEEAQRLKKRRALTYPEFVALKEKFLTAQEGYVKYHDENLLKLNDIIISNNAKFDKLYNWFEQEVYDTYLMLHVYSNALYRVNIPFALDTSHFYDEIDGMKKDWNAVSKDYERLYQLREETVELTDGSVQRMDGLTSKVKEIAVELRAMEESWGASNN